MGNRAMSTMALLHNSPPMVTSAWASLIGYKTRNLRVG